MMNRGKNPCPIFLTDEVSDVEVPDISYKILAEGYNPGERARRIIKSVIKADNGMVLVFDQEGEQIPEYQGHYEKVKPHILKDAPPTAIFTLALDGESALKLKTVPKEEW